MFGGLERAGEQVIGLLVQAIALPTTSRHHKQ